MLISDLPERSRQLPSLRFCRGHWSTRRGVRCHAKGSARTRSVRLVVAATFVVLLLQSGAALARVCAPPRTPTKVVVDLKPGEVRYNNDKDTADFRFLERARVGSLPDMSYRPMGLAVPGIYEPFITMKFAYQRAPVAGSCVSLAEVIVTPGYDQIDIYISSDYPEGSCEYNSILGHEHKHLRVFQETLTDYEAEFQAAIARALQNKTVMFARNKSAAHDAFKWELQWQLYPVRNKMYADMERRNDVVDAPENLRREQAVCDNWTYLVGRRSHGANTRAGAKRVRAPSRDGSIDGSTGMKIVGAPTQPLKTEPYSGPKFVSPP